MSEVRPRRWKRAGLGAGFALALWGATACGDDGGDAGIRVDAGDTDATVSPIGDAGAGDAGEDASGGEADGSGQTGEDGVGDGSASDGGDAEWPDGSQADGESPEVVDPDAGIPDSAVPDTDDGGAPDGGEADATDAAADTVGSDGGGSDAGAPDALEPDAGQAAECGDCPWNQQPASPHPGSAEKLFTVDIETVAEYGPADTSVVLYRPSGPGPYPVLGFVHGKQLYEGGSNPFSPVLGYAYRDMLVHVAGKGYLVVFVRVEQGLLDADHARMADDFLAAMQHALDTEPKADPDAVAFAGHSMGAKVALIAAGKATALDASDTYADPTAVYLMAFENSPPPVGDYVDARDFVAEWEEEPVWTTFIDAADDAIAPWNGSNPNSSDTYDTLGASHKQIILIHGTGSGDPNPQTSPELRDDHAAPMSITGKNGGLADFATPDSYLDALDWYGYWKILVGGLDYHFYDGAYEWAYGALRTHGGVLPNGVVITHEVAKESL